MKQEFLSFLNALMEASPEIVHNMMTDDIQAYINMLSDVKDEKPTLTENGTLVLKYLQEHSDARLWKSKDVAEGLGISSRCVSGALRKLVNDGFCEKFGQNPVVYNLTEKGKNYTIN